jgi:hypothetical protein
MKNIFFTIAFLFPLFGLATSNHTCPPFASEGIVPANTKVYAVSKDCYDIERSYRFLGSTYDYQTLNWVFCGSTQYSIVKIYKPGSTPDVEIITVDSKDLM